MHKSDAVSTIGQRVRVTREIDLEMHGTVAVDEVGTVTAYCPDTGETWITLDKYHAGLADYGNAMWLSPPWTDDFSDAVVPLEALPIIPLAVVQQATTPERFIDLLRVLDVVVALAGNIS